MANLIQSVITKKELKLDYNQLKRGIFPSFWF